MQEGLEERHRQALEKYRAKKGECARAWEELNSCVLAVLKLEHHHMEAAGSSGDCEQGDAPSTIPTSTSATSGIGSVSGGSGGSDGSIDSGGGGGSGSGGSGGGGACGAKAMRLLDDSAQAASAIRCRPPHVWPLAEARRLFDYKLSAVQVASSTVPVWNEGSGARCRITEVHVFVEGGGWAMQGCMGGPCHTLLLQLPHSQQPHHPCAIRDWLNITLIPPPTPSQWCASKLVFRWRGHKERGLIQRTKDVLVSLVSQCEPPKVVDLGGEWLALGPVASSLSFSPVLAQPLGISCSGSTGLTLTLNPTYTWTARSLQPSSVPPQEPSQQQVSPVSESLAPCTHPNQAPLGQHWGGDLRTSGQAGDSSAGSAESTPPPSEPTPPAANHTLAAPLGAGCARQGGVL